MTGQITICNQSKRVTEIQIEGIIGIPEKMQFDDPQERIATYETFRKTLQDIGEIKTKNVRVNIRSTGGNVNDALLIHDALSSLPAEITTRCYGYVASAATIIAQAATKGRREISRNALYLIHRASSAAEGNAGELTQTADLLEKTDERIAAIYASASGREKLKFTELMQENNGNGRWLSPEEALEQGLADKITGTAEIGNEAKEILWEPGLPEIPAELLRPSDRASGSAGMKLRKHWNTVLDFLKIREEEPDENRAGNNIQDLPGRVDALAELEQQIAQCENPMPNDTVQKIADLQNRIAELEALNAKLRAKATQTLPKEDPSSREIRRNGNAAAYENDMKNLLHV